MYALIPALTLLFLWLARAEDIHYREIDIGGLKCDNLGAREQLDGCRFSVVSENDQQVSCKMVVRQRENDEIVTSFRKIMINTISFRLLDKISGENNYCASLASMHLQISDSNLTEAHTETDLPPGFISFLNFFTNDSFAHIEFRKRIPLATVYLRPECQDLSRKEFREECVDKVLFLKEIKRGTFKLDFNGDQFWSFVKRRFVESLGAELTHLSVTKSDRLFGVPLQFIARVLSQELRMRELTAAKMPLGDVERPLISMPTLEVLRLPGDRITKFSEEALRFVPGLKELDLSDNELEKLPPSLPGGLEALNASHNRLLALNTMLPDTLITLNVSYNNFETLPETLPAGLQTLEASHNSLQRLPDKFPATLRLLLVSHNLLRTLPGHLPATLEMLQLSGNQLQQLNPQLLVPLQELQVLDVSYNRLSTADDIWLSHHMQLLNMSHNTLQQIKLMGPGNVSHIDASHNKIESWKVRADRITLLGNSRSPLGLKLIRVEDLAMTIDLGESMLLNCDSCAEDSEVALQLQRWMLRQQSNVSLGGPRVVRPAQPVCTDPQAEAGKPLVEVVGLEDRSGCPGSPRYIAQFLLLLISLLAVIGTVGALCYHRRYEITYVMHLMKMRRERVAAERFHPSSYKYDAFVCYSSADSAWVKGQLLPKLEHKGDSPDEPALRLCLHDMHFPLGSRIAENIISAMNNSRSTVVVLSQAFVDSQWCRWELELASSKVHHLVLLELEKMQRSRLPRNLRYLMDTRTYVEWPTQPRAQQAKWKQLRSVLAAPAAAADDDTQTPNQSDQQRDDGHTSTHQV